MDAFLLLIGLGLFALAFAVWYGLSGATRALHRIARALPGDDGGDLGALSEVLGRSTSHLRDTISSTVTPPSKKE